ncbi:phage terminase large subunit family protein, partial [Escherichia coli]
DRRRWYWPCPDCGDYFQPSMEAMTGYRDNPDPVLASSASQDAARAEQATSDADKAVQKAVDKLSDAATLTGEAKASAEAAA